MTHNIQPNSGATPSSAEPNRRTLKCKREMPDTLPLIISKYPPVAETLASYLPLRSLCTFSSVSKIANNNRNSLLASKINNEAIPLQTIPGLNTIEKAVNFTVKNNLWNIDLSGFQVTDEDLQKIATISARVQNLVIHSDRITSTGAIQLLNSLRWLESLDLSTCTRLTDEIGPSLAKILSLRFLNFTGCYSLTDKLTSHLCNLPFVQSLSLNACSNLTSGMGLHLTSFRSLQSLNLNGCFRIDAAIGPHLTHCTSLKFLNFTWTHITSDIGTSLVSLPLLESLDLSYCRHLTDAIGPHLARCISLRSLDLSGCNNLTDTTVENLIGLSSLQFLNIKRCERLSNVIKDRLDRLTSLTASYDRETTNPTLLL